MLLPFNTLCCCLMWCREMSPSAHPYYHWNMNSFLQLFCTAVLCGAETSVTNSVSIFSLNHEQFPSYTPCCSPVGYQLSWIWGVNQDKTCHTRHTNTITELYSFPQHHVAPSQVVLWKQMHHHIPHHHTSWAMLTACIYMCLHRHACTHTHM